MSRVIKSSWEKSKKLINGCALLSCLISISPAFAEYTQVNWETLNLNDQQRSTMYNLDQQWQGSVSEKAPRIISNEKRLKRMMNSPNASTKDILRLQQEIHEDKMELKMEATQIFMNKRRTLTPEQDQKLRRMMQEPGSAGAAAPRARRHH